MHYYKFNIADYRAETVHLSPVEHYIYRTLMDTYYHDEKPIPLETQSVMRRLGLGSDWVNDLNNVLNDFFVKTDSAWTHKRIDECIAEYQSMSDKNKANGSKGGRPKKPSGLPIGTQDKPTHNPNYKLGTTNHELLIKKPLSLNPNDVVELFNNATNFPKVKVLSDSRKKSIKKLLNEMPTIDAWGQFFAVANKSDFLSGRSSDWQANFDWLIKPANAIKVLEGNYTNKIGGSNGTYKNAGRKNSAESHHDTLKQIAAEADEREMGGGDFQ